MEYKKKEIEYIPNRKERRGIRGEPKRFSQIGAIRNSEDEPVKKKGNLNRKKHAKIRTKIGMAYSEMLKIEKLVKKSEQISDTLEKNTLARVSRKVESVLSRNPKTTS